MPGRFCDDPGSLTYSFYWPFPACLSGIQAVSRSRTVSGLRPRLFKFRPFGASSHPVQQRHRWGLALPQLQPGFPISDLTQQVREVDSQRFRQVGLQAPAGFGEGAAGGFVAVAVEELVEGGCSWDVALRGL